MYINMPTLRELKRKFNPPIIFMGQLLLNNPSFYKHLNKRTREKTLEILTDSIALKMLLSWFKNND